MFKNFFSKIATHVFPSMGDSKSGGACHEAAFDADQFPETMKKVLQKKDEDGNDHHNTEIKED